MEGLAHGDFNKTFEEIVKNMGEEDMQFDKDTEDNIKKLLQEVENNPDMANIMEGMMQSLISKDILYEPIKEMKDKVYIYMFLLFNSYFIVRALVKRKRKNIK